LKKLKQDTKLVDEGIQALNLAKDRLDNGRDEVEIDSLTADLNNILIDKQSIDMEIETLKKHTIPTTTNDKKVMKKAIAKQQKKLQKQLKRIQKLESKLNKKESSSISSQSKENTVSIEKKSAEIKMSSEGDHYGSLEA